MKLTNYHNLPEHLVEKIRLSVEDQPYETAMEDKPYFRVTELIGPPLVRTLMNRYRHTDQLVCDASEFLVVLLGTAVHAIMEGQDTETLKFEQKVAMDFSLDEKTYWVVGTIDEQDLSSVALTDNKTGMTFKANKPIDEDYAWQLNIYALISNAFQRGEPRLYNRFWYKDWAKTKAMIDRSYPPCAIQERAVLTKQPDEIEQFILSRIEDHISNPERPCTEQERSYGHWSVVSLDDPNGKSKKNADTFSEAEVWLLGKHPDAQAGLTITYRGKDEKCRMYCTVRSVCPYAQEKGYV